MKLFSIIATGILYCLTQQDNAKLQGIYRVEFDKKYQSQTFQLTFKDSVYVKKMPDALTYKGKIVYQKFKVTLKENADDNPIEIDTREINKDTIKFTTRSKSDLSKVMNRGKLIRMK